MSVTMQFGFSCMHLSCRQRLFSFSTWAIFILFVPLNFATPFYYAVNDSDKSIHVYVYAQRLCDKKLSSFLYYYRQGIGGVFEAVSSQFCRTYIYSRVDLHE